MGERRKIAYKNTQEKFVEKLLKESFLAFWFIRTFVQYIEYNVSSYKGKSKTK